LQQEDGSFTSREKDCEGMFSKFYRNLFFDPDKEVDIVPPSLDKGEPSITHQEVQDAISRLRWQRAPGWDGINGAMVKAGGNVMANFLTLFLNKCIRDGVFPDDFRLGIMIPSLKPNKPPGTPSSFRTITLLSTVRNVLTSIWAKRACKMTTSIVRSSQCGFRPGVSTADAVFVMRCVAERSKLGDWKAYASMLDMSRAFDSVDRAKLIQRVHDTGLPVVGLASLLSSTKIRIMVNSFIGPEWMVNVGTVQGDSWSPVGFNIYAEGSLRKFDLVIQERKQVMDKSKTSKVPFSSLQYADDTALLHSNKEELKIMEEVLASVLKEDGLMLNESKTERAVFEKNNDDWKSMKYLGSRIDSVCDINARIHLANVSFASIKWTKHRLDIRLILFKTIVLAVLLYNSALWTLTAKMEKILDVWQRKKLRFIFRIFYPARITNKELLKRAKCKNLSTICRKKRLQWLGHVIRLGEGAIANQALMFARNIGDITKPRGRPPTRWVNVIDKDLCMVDMTFAQAMSAAQDRQKWKSVINKLDRCS